MKSSSTSGYVTGLLRHAEGHSRLSSLVHEREVTLQVDEGRKNLPTAARARMSYLDSMLESANKQRHSQYIPDMVGAPPAFSQSMDVTQQEVVRHRMASEHQGIEQRIQLEMERRATFRDYRHGTIEQVEAAYQSQLCHASEHPTQHGGYVGSLLRRAEHTMLGKQLEIESKAELQARYESRREVVAEHRLAPARAAHAEMQGPGPLAPPPQQEQDDLKSHLSGMREKIASYRSEKQKASGGAATSASLAAQGHSPSPVSGHATSLVSGHSPSPVSGHATSLVSGHSPSLVSGHATSLHNTSSPLFVSLSPSPTMFTSPSPVLHRSPDIQKPDGMTDKHFERLKSIQSRIQGMPSEQATFDSSLLSPSFAVSTPDEDKRSPPRTSVENLRRQLEAVKGEIEAMEHDDA